MNSLIDLGVKAKAASKALITASPEIKNQALKSIAAALTEHSDEIIKANTLDLDAARKNGMSKSLLDRLSLSETRIKGMADGVLALCELSDPVGIILDETVRPNGIKIKKISVPMGVIGIIYEARPNVTSDAAAIAIKAGSAVILRGGKEAINSNMKTAEIMRNAINEVGLPKDLIQLVTDTSRQSATDLMTLNGYLDVLIPRGGAGLIKAAVENSTVPVIETGTGNCHAFVDESANIDMASEIIFNGKVQRPSVCNALESLLVHKTIAEKALPIICEKLKSAGVEIKGCKKTCEILPYAIPADEEDFAKEFLGYTISVKIVDDVYAAVEHIDKYSTHHSEVIITENKNNADYFVLAIDSAAVYVNASTRFTDGGEFGLGAEIGISTQKLHARGPMGLREITSYKYIIDGYGQIR
ncbi:MAG: glutamate-5-semialdehyde dehydrogenase [Clostridia bacterium]|nr:glutamate-5-semialdehyde dehydrogenase [Clostridia bacterium]